MPEGKQRNVQDYVARSHVSGSEVGSLPWQGGYRNKRYPLLLQQAIHFTPFFSWKYSHCYKPGKNSDFIFVLPLQKTIKSRSKTNKFNFHSPKKKKNLSVMHDNRLLKQHVKPKCYFSFATSSHLFTPFSTSYLLNMSGFTSLQLTKLESWSSWQITNWGNFWCSNMYINSFRFISAFSHTKCLSVCDRESRYICFGNTTAQLQFTCRLTCYPTWVRRSSKVVIYWWHFFNKNT